MTVPIIIAHRGASGTHPENTAAAFSASIAAGVMSIETDVQLSSDGIAFLCHDTTLRRFGGSGRNVRTQSWEQLQEADVGSWFARRFADERLLSLRTALRHFSHVHFCLELKVATGAGAVRYHQRLVRSVLDDVIAMRAEERVELLSFSMDLLRFCARKAPAIRRIRNAEKVPASFTSWLKEQKGCHGICLDKRLITLERVALAQERGLRVYTWSVNDQRSLDKLLRSGVDGILTDKPAWLVAQM